MAIAASEPDPHATERLSDGAAVTGEEAALAEGQAGSPGGTASRRGGLRLIAGAGPGGADGGTALAQAVAPAGGEPARRLRIAPPAQLELIPAPEGPRAAAVWAGLPEEARQAVLVVLARLIGTGAIEREGEG